MVIRFVFSSMFATTFASRWLVFQDFWTIMSKNFMALMTPSNRTVPIVRQSKWVYLTPTVIPYASYSGPRNELEIGALLDDLDISSLQSDLRGITDCVEHSQYDHLPKIAPLIAAAQKAIKRPDHDQQKKHMDYWEVIDNSNTLVRHHAKLRQTTFGNFNLLGGELPVGKERLTGRSHCHVIQRWHIQDCHR